MIFKSGLLNLSLHFNHIAILLIHIANRFNTFKDIINVRRQEGLCSRWIHLVVAQAKILLMTFSLSLKLAIHLTMSVIYWR